MERIECKHGRLKRQCVTCEVEAEFARLAAESESLRKAILDALPQTAYYLDPPDGGDVPIEEQLMRMAKDAARYRWLRQIGAKRRQAALHYGYGSMNDYIDEAMAAEAGNG